MGKQTVSIENMTKDQLRKACKDAGIKYGSMSNLQMRDALKAAQPPETPAPAEPMVTTPAADPAPAEKPAEAPKPKAAPAAKQPQRNGVTQPKAGSICASIWNACAELKADGKEMSFAALKEKLPKVNDATLRTQRQRFNTFHG
jgi:outer membrane biosynthesis protein TonB